MERPGDLAFWGWEDHLSDSGAGEGVPSTALGTQRELLQDVLGLDRGWLKQRLTMNLTTTQDKHQQGSLRAVPVPLKDT